MATEREREIVEAIKKAEAEVKLAREALEAAKEAGADLPELESRQRITEERLKAMKEAFEVK